MKLPFAHKPGQGMRARWGATALMSSLWAWAGLASSEFLVTLGFVDAVPVPSELPIEGFLWAHVVGFGVWLVLTFLTYLLCNGARGAEILIETEQELRKVNWPTMDRVMNSSVVVVICVIIFAGLLFGADAGINQLITILNLW